MTDKCKFEVREVDALCEPDGSWNWNNSIHIGDFETCAEDKYICRAFMRYLKKIGITFKRGAVKVVDDIDILEVQSRKTGEPLYAAIWIWGNE